MVHEPSPESPDLFPESGKKPGQRPAGRIIAHPTVYTTYPEIKFHIEREHLYSVAGVRQLRSLIKAHEEMHSSPVGAHPSTVPHVHLSHLSYSTVIELETSLGSGDSGDSEV